MRVVALSDFGSTFTKVTLVEEGSGRLLARSHHATTLATDVMDGYHTALDGALAQLDPPAPDVVKELAASSAGGGLRMATVGLVDELTAEAGRLAALNAGAKVDLVAAGDLDETTRARLAEVRPEVLLFCGGTDGGQRDKVLANAAVVAGAACVELVVVACNTEIARDVAAMFDRADRTVHVVDNVLPTIDRLNIEPARRAIHDLFIRHVIGGKRLSRGGSFESMVRKPTPEAVLDAVRMLATWEHDEPDGVVVVDVGGATTDVHSALAVDDRPAYITPTGLPSLPVTRSVQGDLGMRWGARSVVAADRVWLTSALEVDDAELDDAARQREQRPDWLPSSDGGRRADDALAVSCIHLALHRHCGSLSARYVPGQGTQFVQRGLDLRAAPLLIGTGGPLVRRPDSEQLLARALERRQPGSLVPQAPRFAVDHSYVLAAAGLLSTHDRDAARGLLEHLRGELHAPSTR